MNTKYLLLIYVAKLLLPKACILNFNTYYNETFETSRVIKCQLNNTFENNCSRNDFRQKIGIKFSNNNLNYQLIDVEIFKIESPKGSVKYICSYNDDNLFCVRTFLEGTLKPSNNILGDGGLNININKKKCSMFITRHVYFGNSNVAAIGLSMFNI